MPNYGEYRAWVTVDGEATPEFDVKLEAPSLEYASTEPTTVNCWIPSELGKEFQVHVNNPATSDLTCKLVIDNRQCGYLLHKNFDTSRTLDFAGLRVSPTQEAPFIFSKIETSDDDSLLSQSAAPGQGEISIAIREVKELAKDPRPVFYDAVPNAEKCHERMKKAIDHRVGFGDIKQVKAYGGPVSISNVRQVVKFVFKYRPLDILQASGIAPLPPRPPQEDVKPEIIELSDDEDAEREEKALRKRLAELEKKRKNKRVKTEHRPVKLERSSGSESSDEVIDLTL